MCAFGIVGYSSVSCQSGMTASAAEGIATCRLRATLDAAGFVAGRAAPFVQHLCEGFGQGLTATPLYKHRLSASWSERCHYLVIAHTPGRAGLLRIKSLHHGLLPFTVCK